MKEQIEVSLPNNKKIIVPFKTRALDVIKESGNFSNDILACRVNNVVKSLEYKLIDDTKLEYIYYNEEDGYKVYTRALKFVLFKSVKRLYPEHKLKIQHSLNRAYFCGIEGININQDIVNGIKAEMDKIVAADYKFEKYMIPSEEARLVYQEANDIDKLKLLENRFRNYVTVYCCDGDYNYFYGNMVPSTGYIKGFSLDLYDDGFFLRMPRKTDINLMDTFKESPKLFQVFREYEHWNEIIGINTIGELNDCVMKDKIGDVIRLSEALHDRKIVEIAQEIGKRDKLKMILIAGPSSSGKTTFAQKLSIQLMLDGIKPITISMDNFFVEREQTPFDEEGKPDYECIEALDLKLFNQVMSDLIAGKEVEMPRFDFKQGRKIFDGKKMKMLPHQILVVEGIHGLNEKMTEFISRENKFKIYISALTALSVDNYTKVSTIDTRLIRRMVRDHQFRGYPATTTLEMWPSVRRGEEKYIFPYQEDADFIYNSSLIYELSVFKTFAQPLLMQIDSKLPIYSEAKRIFDFLNNFMTVETTEIPIDSLVREFIGNGCFYR